MAYQLLDSAAQPLWGLLHLLHSSIKSVPKGGKKERKYRVDALSNAINPHKPATQASSM
jgi:hypothetical protein